MANRPTQVPDAEVAGFPAAPSIVPRLVTGDDLAREFGYPDANNAFREWAVMMGITPVPGRRGYYDRKLAHRRLDEKQGLVDDPAGQASDRSVSLVERRRKRLASA